mgnify:CR=1 FL=1
MKVEVEKLRRIVVEELKADAAYETVLPEMTSKIPLIPPPPPGSPEEILELYAVMEQYQNRIVPENLQQMCDEDLVGVFQKTLNEVGISINYSYYNKLKDDIRKPYKKLKKLFNRRRPHKLAAALGLDFQFDDLPSAKSKSYPSGHTVQSYVVAHFLADLHPEHSDLIFGTAELISQSRIDRGVHYPSDLDYGRIVAEYVYKEVASVLEVSDE